MKQMFLILASVSTLSLVGCGDIQPHGTGQSVDQSVFAQQQMNSSNTVCAWGLGIFSSENELKSFAQNKINLGQLTHCVALDGQMLVFTSPNGLFGPCLSAVSQAKATYEQWASCSSSIQ